MSLRHRLVAGILGLLLIAVLATDVVTYSSLRSFLVGRLDEQISVAQDQGVNYIESAYVHDAASGNTLVKTNPSEWLARLGTTASLDPDFPESDLASSGAQTTAPPTARGSAGLAGQPARGPRATGTPADTSSPQLSRLNGAALSARISPDVYVVVTNTDGSPLYTRPSGSDTYQDPPPVISGDIPVIHGPRKHRFGGTQGPYLPDQPSFSMSSIGTSGTQYRAQAVSVPGGILITASPMTPVIATLGSVVHVELVVSLVVMLTAVLVALAVVRLGLRPLDDMTETAGAIAAGDMTRRIRWTDEHTEVGRLGQALNGMLSQIEAAFSQRKSSEARLRRFAADASHELRTPLTSIRGYAELLRKGAITDEDGRRRAATRIEHEAARLGVMVDDLLLLARLDQGRPLEREAVDLRQIVTEAVEDFRVVQPERTIDLDVNGPVLVLGDSGRLRQIVDNLVRNAIVHTPVSAAVHVAVHREGDDGEQAVMTVADEGPGLEPDQVSQVFDRFYRSSAARTGEGSGLGLSIVAAIAKAHGGEAKAESEPGRGARFTVQLPADPSDSGRPDRFANDQNGDFPGQKSPEASDEQSEEVPVGASLGQESLEQESLGQESPGQEKLGNEKPGQEKPRQERPGQASPRQQRRVRRERRVDEGGEEQRTAGQRCEQRDEDGVRGSGESQLEGKEVPEGVGASPRGGH